MLCYWWIAILDAYFLCSFILYYPYEKKNITLCYNFLSRNIESSKFISFQDYLREQPDNIKSVNLVAETAKFLQLLYSSINAGTIGLVTELFNTLIEFTSVSFDVILLLM